MIINGSKPYRLLAALRRGEQLTAKQISTRFRAANPRDVVYSLRNEGFNINLIETKNSKGIERRKYVLAA